MAPPGGEIKLLFHANNAKFPLSHAKPNVDMFNILGVVRYRSFVVT